MRYSKSYDSIRHRMLSESGTNRVEADSIETCAVAGTKRKCCRLKRQSSSASKLVCTAVQSLTELHRLWSGCGGARGRKRPRCSVLDEATAWFQSEIYSMADICDICQFAGVSERQRRWGRQVKSLDPGVYHCQWRCSPPSPIWEGVKYIPGPP